MAKNMDRKIDILDEGSCEWSEMTVKQCEDTFNLEVCPWVQEIRYGDTTLSMHGYRHSTIIYKKYNGSWGFPTKIM